MHPIVANFKTTVQSAINYLKEDLKAIRTGRASTGLIEGLIVETYGGSTKLKLMEMATLTTEGSDAIIIVPFDPSTSEDVEKALLKSPLGFNPQPQGGRIIVRIPPLSEEQRQKYIKLISQKVEERKVTIRGERDAARKKIKAMETAKELSEDERARLEKEIDTITQDSSNEITTLREHKERDIMEV